MFDDFTQKANDAMEMAQEEARRLGHDFVGVEQMLLGLVAEGTGAAARVLKAKGVTLGDARMEVERIIQRGSGFVGVEIPFTQVAHTVLDNARAESRKLDISLVATEHLLLAILKSDEKIPSQVLEALGVDLEDLEHELLKVASQREGARLIDHRNINLLDHCHELISSVDKISRVSDKIRLGIKELCERSDISKPEAEKIAVEICSQVERVEEKLSELKKIESNFSKEKNSIKTWAGS